MSIKPRIGRVFKHPDPKIERALDEIIAAIQRIQLTSADIKTSELAPVIGKLLLPGQVTALNRIIEGKDDCLNIKILSDNADPALFIDGYTDYAIEAYAQGSLPVVYLSHDDGGTSGECLRMHNVGTGDTIYDTSGAKLTSAGVWTDAPCFDHLKEEIIEVRDDDILNDIKLLQSVKKWKRKANGVQPYHMGPEVSNFHSTLGLGDGKSIAPKDVASVALRACQALLTKVEQQKQRIDDLEARVLALETV